MANLKMAFVSESGNFFKMLTQGSWANSPENYGLPNLTLTEATWQCSLQPYSGDGYLNTASSSLSLVFPC